MTTQLMEVGCVKLATITGFSSDVFGTADIATCGKKYPQLLVLGIQIQHMDPETLLSRGPFVLARGPTGMVVAGTYQIWKTVVPELLKEVQTAQLAGNINTLFARLGLSCC
jgi:hypothetical protein